MVYDQSDISQGHYFSVLALLCANCYKEEGPVSNRLPKWTTLYKKQRERRQNQAAAITAICQSLPDLVLCKDLNFQYTSCNLSYEQFAGCGRAELAGKTNFEIPGLPERISGDFTDAEQKVIREKSPAKAEGWLTYPDGSRKYFEALNTPLLRNGKVTGLLGILRNITELHDGTKALRKQHERARLMLDAAPLCCFLLDRDYRFLDCNDEASKFFGYSDKRDLLVRAPNPACLMPIYQPDGRLSSEVAAHVIDEVFNEKSGMIECEHWLLDGTPIPASVTLIRVAYGGDFAVAAYVKDLREQKQMMLEIETQRNHLEEALEQKQTAVQSLQSAHMITSSIFKANSQMNILFDSCLRVVDCNPAAMQFMNFETKEDMLAGFHERIAQYMPALQPDGRVTKPVSERLIIAAKEGCDEFVTELHMGNEKKHILIELKKIPYKSSFAIIAYAYDITDVRSREKAKSQPQAEAEAETATATVSS